MLSNKRDFIFVYSITIKARIRLQIQKLKFLLSINAMSDHRTPMAFYIHVGRTAPCTTFGDEWSLVCGDVSCPPALSTPVGNGSPRAVQTPENVLLTFSKRHPAPGSANSDNGRAGDIIEIKNIIRAVVRSFVVVSTQPFVPYYRIKNRSPRFRFFPCR